MEWMKTRLSNLLDGKADALFEEALEKVRENIADEETEAKKARKIHIEVAFTPTELREQGIMTVSVKTTLLSKTKLTAFSMDHDGILQYRDAEQLDLLEMNRG